MPRYLCLFALVSATMVPHGNYETPRMAHRAFQLRLRIRCNCSIAPQQPFLNILIANRHSIAYFLRPYPGRFARLSRTVFSVSHL